MRKRRRTCKHCNETFVPERSNQVFVNSNHRKEYWDGLRKITPKEFKEFLEWKKSRKKVPPKVPLLKKKPAAPRGTRHTVKSRKPNNRTRNPKPADTGRR